MKKPAGKQKIEDDSYTNGEDSGALDSDLDSFDETTVLNEAKEFKEEGNILFQRHDHRGALLKYEQALNLLPKDHNDVPYLRSYMAACYMQMDLVEYPEAISECNLALEVAPTYNKALLKRARCYAAMNRLDSALRDVNHVLSVEPNNLSALAILDKLKKADRQGSTVDDKEILLPPADYVEPALIRALKERVRKRRNSQLDNNKAEDKEETKVDRKVEKVAPKKEEKCELKKENVSKKEENVDEKNAEDKIMVSISEEVVTKTVKLVCGDDIRFAQLPVKCSIRVVRDIVQERFPNLKGALIKYRDQEGDLITITTTDELRLAEQSGGPLGSMRLYIVEVSPDKEPPYERKVKNEKG